MAKHIDSLMKGLKISDLINEDGITFEIGEQFDDVDDEEFAFSPHVQFSNEEMLNMLNMNDFEDDDNNETGTVSLCGTSFSKLKMKMTSLTTDEKVMKFVKQKGVGDVVPSNAQVTVHYIGYFEYRDEPFDSTYSCGKPKSLRLGQGHIIPGLELGILSMHKHEISMFLIHPDLAFKSIGCPPRIPPNEEVVFVVHLMDYVDDGCALTYSELSTDEKQLFAHAVEPITHMLVTAKDYFSKFNYKRAIREYRRAIDCLETIKLKDAEEERKMNELLSRAYTNLGLCYNKENLPLKACIVLKQVPIPTAKSYYHFGKALIAIGEYEDALKELIKARSLEQNDEAIRKAIQIANTKQYEYKQISKRMYENCFKTKDKQKKVTEFRKAVRDLCETLLSSEDVVRQALSEGITKEEYEIVREEAAVLGLNVVTSTRNGKNTVYLQKNRE